jgi:hypothetical protein
LGSINGNRDGPNRTSGLDKGRLGARGNILVTGDVTTRVGSLVLASVGTSGGVRVGSLGVKTLVLDNVLEGVIHETTVAALITLGSGAINKILLGEGSKSSRGDLVATLNGAGGGERPARSALSLILDGGDGTLRAPINGGRGGGENILNLAILDHVGGINNDVHSVVHLSELLRIEIGKFIEGDLEFTIPVLDEIVVLGKDCEAVLELGSRVRAVILLHPRKESSLVLEAGSRPTSKGNRKKKSNGKDVLHC